MSHVEKIESVKLHLSTNEGKDLGYVKNNGTGSKSTMNIVSNIKEATEFDVMTYDSDTKSIKDPCYYKLKDDSKYYLDMHENAVALKQTLFADKPNLTVSASTIASWTLNGDYLQTRIGGFRLGKIDNNDNLVAVTSQKNALKVDAVKI